MRVIQVLDEISDKNISLVSVADTISKYNFLSKKSNLIVGKSKKDSKKKIIVKSLLSNLFYASEVNKILKYQKPSIVHIHGLWRPIHLFFMLHCVLLNIPLCIQPHGMLLKEALKSKSFLSYLGKLIILFFFYKILLNRSNFVAVTEEEKQSIKKYFPISNISIIQNPIVSQKIKTKKLKKNFVYFGRFNKHKNLKEFIEAFILSKPSEDWSFDIYGIEDDVAYKLELFKIVEKSKFSKLIKFHKPEFDKKKKFIIISQAWCNVLPSKSEVLSLSVLEALSVGTQSLVNEDIFFPKWIKDNLISSKVDNFHLTKKIKMIMKEDHKSKLIKKKKIQELFKIKYSTNKGKNLYQNFLENILDDFKRNSSISNFSVLFSNLLNSILIPYLMVIAVFFGNSTLGAEIGIFPGIVLLLTQIFSANARSILLYNKGSRLYEQILYWRILIGLLIFSTVSLIQFYFYEADNSIVLYLLNLIVYISWINEINLANHEKNRSSFIIKLFLFVGIIFYILLFLSYAVPAIDILSLIKWFIFFHILFFLYHLDFSNLNFQIFMNYFRKQFSELLSLASSFFNIFGVIVWRISLIFVLEKNIVGLFFASFAIASFPGTLFNNIIGQIMLINKHIKDVVLKYVKIYFGLYFLIMFLLLCTNYLYFNDYKLYYFFKITLVSLIGTPFMLMALYNRHKLLSFNKKNQRIIFKRDILYGLLMSPIVIILYTLGDEDFILYSFLISSVLAFACYKKFSNDK